MSPPGIAGTIRLGVCSKKNLNEEILRNYQVPFKTKEAQKVLLKTVQQLSRPKDYKEIAEKLPNFNVPVRLIYGENDKFLTNIAMTMNRLKRDLTKARLIKLSNCGHFLQEDEPTQLSQLLEEFFNSS